jgi:hypothetical protein
VFAIANFNCKPFFEGRLQGGLVVDFSIVNCFWFFRNLLLSTSWPIPMVIGSALHLCPDRVLTPLRGQDSKPSSHSLLESKGLPPLPANVVLSSQRLQALLVF